MKKEEGLARDGADRGDSCAAFPGTRGHGAAITAPKTVREGQVRTRRNPPMEGRSAEMVRAGGATVGCDFGAIRRRARLRYHGEGGWVVVGLGSAKNAVWAQTTLY